MAAPRVIVLAPERLPNRWAHSHAIAQLSRALARCGAAVELWHRAAPGQGADVLAYYGMGPELSIRVFRGPRLPLPRRPGSGPRLARVLGAARMAAAVPRRSVDLCLTRSATAAFVLAQRGVPVVYHEHRVPSGPERHLVARAARRPALRAALAVSEYVRADLAQRGVPAGRTGLLPGGVDLDRFRSLPPRAECRLRVGLPPDRPVVGYVGTVTLAGAGEKGVATLVQALARLDPSVVLACVGGPLEALPPYLEAARSLGIDESRLRFVGHVPAAEVPLWIRACDVATIPLRRTREGALVTAPLKLFEYMAAGTPVVASDLPTLRPYLRDGESALLVEPESPAALAGAVARLLAEPALGAALAAAARRDVEGHTWERRAEIVLAALPGERGP